jgi:hypothetical protein
VSIVHQARGCDVGEEVGVEMCARRNGLEAKEGALSIMHLPRHATHCARRLRCFLACATA